MIFDKTTRDERMNMERDLNFMQACAYGLLLAVTIGAIVIGLSLI